MFSLFHYDFIVRGLEVGLVIGAVAPLIGIFLVLRRYAIIADTLSHVSLAGVALGLLLAVNPLMGAIVVTVASSVVIERLRLSKKTYGDSALSIFLSGGLAVAVVILGLAHGFSVDIFNYLFGSIVTVAPSDVYLIFGLGIVVLLTIVAFYKELVFITFDEETAKVGGIPARAINILLIVLAAFTVALSIPIVGILLISALIVIPVVAALQLKKGFFGTIVYSEIFSMFSVLFGIVCSFYLNIPAGGAIVIIALLIFIGCMLYER